MKEEQGQTCFFCEGQLEEFPCPTAGGEPTYHCPSCKWWFANGVEATCTVLPGRALEKSAIRIDTQQAIIDSLRAELAAKSELAESLNRLAETLREENGKLRELIQSAMPLLWIHYGDVEAADEWRTKVHAALTGREG